MPADSANIVTKGVKLRIFIVCAVKTANLVVGPATTVKEEFEQMKKRKETICCDFNWILHQIRHFSKGFIGLPIGQSNALENDGKFCSGTFTLKK